MVARRRDPIEEEAKALLAYQRNPLLFVQNELGISCEVWRKDKPPKKWKRNYWPLWSKQRKILKALVKHRRVCVKSGHTMGKTWTAAIATLYLLYVWKGLGLTTAPGFRQVRRQLWGEIHNLYGNSPIPLGGTINQTSLELGPRWYVEGFSTDNPSVSFTGFHEGTVFVILDEAGGISDQVFNMLDTVLASENSFVLQIGNPIDSSTFFYDCFKPGSGYYPITISCWDSPNVVNQKTIYPKLCAPDWPERMLKKWGKNDPWYLSRVLGEFPKENRDVVIPYEYIEQALQRELPEDFPKCISCDVSRRGSDVTKVGILWNSGRFRIIDSVYRYRNTEVAGKLITHYRHYEKILKDKNISQELFVNVDDVGCGGGVVDMLVEANIPVNGVVSQERPDNSQEDYEKFHNLRAQGYWNLREAYISGEVDIDSEDLAFELSRITKETSSRGKIKIIDKEKLRKILKGRSGDSADCQMMAYTKGEADLSGELVRLI